MRKMKMKMSKINNSKSKTFFCSIIFLCCCVCENSQQYNQFPQWPKKNKEDKEKKKLKKT